MIYVVAKQHPTLPEVSMFTTKSKADADQYRAIGWTVLGIAGPPSETEKTRFVDRSWAQFCAGIGDSKDAPYPGMIAAFESHYGQSFADKDWRNEASVWAQAWQAAIRTQPVKQAQKGGD